MRPKAATNGIGLGSFVNSEANDGALGVGPTCSSLRAGKPFTWRRGWRLYLIRSGYIHRTCRAGYCMKTKVRALHLVRAETF